MKVVVDKELIEDITSQKDKNKYKILNAYVRVTKATDLPVVDAKSPVKDLEKVFKKAALVLHPDKNDNPAAPGALTKLTTAYDKAVKNANENPILATQVTPTATTPPAATAKPPSSQSAVNAKPKPSVPAPTVVTPTAQPDPKHIYKPFFAEASPAKSKPAATSRPAKEKKRKYSIEEQLASMFNVQKNIMHKNHNTLLASFSALICKIDNFNNLAIVATFVQFHPLFQWVKRDTRSTKIDSLYAQCLGQIKEKIITVNNQVAKTSPKKVTATDRTVLQALLAQHRTKQSFASRLLFCCFPRPQAARANTELNVVVHEKSSR